MAIPWGNSVLKQANDADDAANDLINQNLHEHFKMARRANMGVQNPSEGEPDESHYDGPKKEIVLHHEPTGTHTYLTHNRKTGEVSQTPYEATGFRAHGTSSDPKEARSHLNSAKKESRAFQKREA